MMINGRLLLLVAVTALFVRVWSGNSGRHGQSVSRAHPALSQNLGPWHAIHPVSRPVVAAHSVSATTHHDAHEEVWTVTTSPIALPAGMAPGVYRVVDDTGRVARLEIASGHEHTAGSHVVPADFHMATIGARRWYFIRLQATTVTSAIAPALQPAQNETPLSEEARASRPAFTNPKFDFTGYCPTGSAVETVAEEFRPESPDLPVTR
jgi:hypothetical protein